MSDNITTVGGRTPFSTKHFDSYVSNTFASLFKNQSEDAAKFINRTPLDITKIMPINPVPGQTISSINNDVHLKLSWMPSLFMLGGFDVPYNYNVQKTLMALSTLEKLHSKKEIFATWGLVSFERALTVARSQMDTVNLDSIPRTDVQQKHVFNDIVETRTVQGAELIEVLQLYDDLCVILQEKAVHWVRVPPERQKMVILLTTLFCDLLFYPMHYVKIAKNAESYRVRINKKKLPREVLAKMCHQMQHKMTSVPTEIMIKRVRPRKNELENWVHQNNRNRILIHRLNQSLAKIIGE